MQLTVTGAQPLERTALPGAAVIASLEFLAFAPGEEEYSIDIRKMQKICGYGAVTRIANAPKVIKDVVNLRGIQCRQPDQPWYAGRTDADPDDIDLLVSSTGIGLIEKVAM